MKKERRKEKKSETVIPEGGRWKPDAGSKNPSLIQSPREKHSSSASPPRNYGLEEGEQEEEGA